MINKCECGIDNHDESNNHMIHKYSNLTLSTSCKYSWPWEFPMGVRAARAGAPTAAITKLVAAKSTWPRAGTQKHLSKRSLRAWLSSSPSWPVKCLIRGCMCERSIITAQHILHGQCTYRVQICGPLTWCEPGNMSGHVQVQVWNSHTASHWLINRCYSTSRTECETNSQWKPTWLCIHTRKRISKHCDSSIQQTRHKPPTAQEACAWYCLIRLTWTILRGIHQN